MAAGRLGAAGSFAAAAGIDLTPGFDDLEAQLLAKVRRL